MIAAHRLGLALLLAAAAPFGARAAAPEVGFVDAGASFCFSRAYTASHLSRNPRQQVNNIALIYEPVRVFGGERPQKQWDVSGGAPTLFATLAVRMEGRSRTLLAAVTCKARSGVRTLNCVVDEDGGSFSLRQLAEGIMLDNPNAFRVSPATGNHDRDMAESATVDSLDDHKAFLLTATEQNPICGTKWPGL